MIELILTPACERTDGSIREALRIIKEEPNKYYMPNQFININNTLSHYETTGPEIFAQTEGEIDVFVAGMGTTGTLMGIAMYLKEKKPGIKVVGVGLLRGMLSKVLKIWKKPLCPRSTIRK
ncbi:MAG: pyridoxal-phosphate dependent enzyme [Candidatus Syntrophopropionicum ammoniitolerans]